MIDRRLTSELITREACEQILNEYFLNWSREGIHKINKNYYSETGEDGIYEEVLNQIGHDGRFCVEFGAWDGYHLSTTLHMREKYNYNCLLLDGKFENPSINLFKHYLTAENILELFAQYNVPAKFEILTIDIDGNDYHLLKSIISGGYRPRVIGIETNQLISPKVSATIQYDPTKYFDVNSRYFSGSARAYDNLLKKNNYSMLGMHDQNCFFILNEELPNLAISIDGLGDIEKLFKPRIPRWYEDSDGNKFCTSKESIEELAMAGKTISKCTPLVEKTMKTLIEDGVWEILVDD